MQISRDGGKNCRHAGLVDGSNQHAGKYPRQYQVALSARDDQLLRLHSDKHLGSSR